MVRAKNWKTFFAKETETVNLVVHAQSTYPRTAAAPFSLKMSLPEHYAILYIIISKEI